MIELFLITWMQTAQVDPKVKQWFNDQVIPGTRQACCSLADGTAAEEDIREGHYWTRWPGSDGWIQVPDKAVLETSNPNGSPVVWWNLLDSSEDGSVLVIRCFAPGAKS